VKALIDRGVDVNAKTPKGETALGLARLRGQTPVVDLLIKAGAKDEGRPPEPRPQPKPADSPRAALQRSLPLLQRTDSIFLPKSGCVSCHNNILAAMTVAAARKHGVAVDEAIAASQVKSIAAYLESWRERALQGIGIPGDSDTVSYILIGMAAQNYPPDPATDATASAFLRERIPARSRPVDLGGGEQLGVDGARGGCSAIVIELAGLRTPKKYLPEARDRRSGLACGVAIHHYRVAK
jgi:hypothetical protein